MHKDKTGVLHDAGNCKQCEEEDMKRYLVSWTEKHSAIVDAEDETQAIDSAYWEDAIGTLDTQEIDSVEVIRPDDMDVAKESA